MGAPNDANPESDKPPGVVAAVRDLETSSQLDFEIGFYSGLLERDPNYVDVLRVIGNNLTARGEYERALEIDRRITLLCPEDPYAHYNLACSCSLLGLVDAGIGALERAVQCGYNEYDYMQEDRDLAALRKDPRFHQLLRTCRGSR